MFLTKREWADDVYQSNEGSLIPGENGDFSGSPYGYYTPTLAPVAATVITDLPTQSTPLLQEAQQLKAASTDVAQASIASNKKPWYDVLAQIGDAAANIINASKGGGVNTGIDVNAGNAETYKSSLPDDSEATKRTPWGWIITAVVVFFVLIFLIVRKKD
jgi:hypothetical protein